MENNMATRPITAWPAPTDAPALLFGGSFDPPHVAHVSLATAARDEVFPDTGWLIFVPASQNPHKPSQPVATDAQRLEMLRLAIQDKPRVAIWTDEIDRSRDNEPSYWADTISRARRVVDKDTPLRFLIGADQAIAFHRWHEHEAILKDAEPAVMLRNPCPTRESFRSTLLSIGHDPAEWMPRLVNTEVLSVASTEARSAIEQGKNSDKMLDELVMGYIELYGLYGSADDSSLSPPVG